MLRVDPQALLAEMNSQRIAHQVTWEEVSREIGVSASTLHHTRKGGRKAVDGVSAMVRWLGVPDGYLVRDSATKT